MDSSGIIKTLHEIGRGDFLVPEVGRRPNSCSNESPVRRPTSGITGEQPEPIVSVGEYRKLMCDTESTDEQIVQRVNYLDSLFREIIRNELHAYDINSIEKTEEHR